MVDIYDVIANGIRIEEGLSEDGLKSRLGQLQSSVRLLRSLYRNYPVTVPYERIDIQAAYLITYFPHYYQLIYKVFIEDFPSIFEKKSKVKLIFFGGGPGSEVYGAIKYIANNRPGIKQVDILIFDINALQWKYSHDILKKHLLESVLSSELKISLNCINFDLTKPFSKEKYGKALCDCDLMVFQNCLNEIPCASVGQLKENIIEMYKLLPPESSILIADLTGGYQSIATLIKQVEQELLSIENTFPLNSIIEDGSCKTMQSVHHMPSQIVRQHLLIGTDGLIPRKYLKYNYSFLYKSVGKKEKELDEQRGLQALYSPLNFISRDANNFLNEKTFIGIDFGTSTTVISMASVVDGVIRTQTIPIAQKDDSGGICMRPLLPSAIALKNCKLLFGIHAYELKSDLQKNINIWHSFKLELGEENRLQYSDSVLFDNLDYPIKNSIDAISLFFKYIKLQIDAYVHENNLPEQVEYAVSIPASFLNSERQDLLVSLQNSMIVVGNNPFIDEPIAAVINYFVERETEMFLESTRKMMVIDCGAGTCDISILEIGKNLKGAYSKNLAISRHGNIGGKLLDRMIAEEVLWKQLVLRNEFVNSLPELDKSAIINALCEVGENLKIKLCKSVPLCPPPRYNLPFSSNSDDIVWIPDVTVPTGNTGDILFEKPSISYRKFYELVDNYCFFHENEKNPINSISYSINTALQKASIVRSDISDILVTGGSFRNPYLLSFISNYFNTAAIIFPDNIQEHVSRGAAIHSLILNTYGANIIQPILSDDIFILHHLGKFKLFSAGTEIPSRDVVLEVVPAFPATQSYIEIPFFIIGIDKPIQSIKFSCLKDARFRIVFFITPEKIVDCEVTENSNEIVHSVSYPSNVAPGLSFTIISK